MSSSREHLIRSLNVFRWLARARRVTCAGLALLAAGCNDAPITEVVTQLAFTVQPPTGTEAGAALTVEVAAQDQSGNSVTSFTGDVALKLETNPSGGVLAGTTTVAAIDGVATFADVSIAMVGSGYQLQAASGTVTSPLSVAFDITPAPASHLTFTAQPSSTAAGAAVSPAVQVMAWDQFGNMGTNFAADVTVRITSGTGAAGAALSGTTTVVAVSGVATFNDLSIDLIGTGYTLTAEARGVTAGTSAAFDITPAPATQLTFSVQPSTTAAGCPITPAVEVTALDQFGGTATGFTGDVAVAIDSNPAGGTLSGTTTVAAADGVTTFSDLRINRSGTGYTLSATSGSLTAGTSVAFDVTPVLASQLVFTFDVTTVPASQLVFTTQPTTTTVGATISPAVEVTMQDALGNINRCFTGDVTVAIRDNPGGGTLSGTTTVGAVAGVTTFSDLTIDMPGIGYTFIATAPPVTPAVSTAFAITP